MYRTTLDDGTLAFNGTIRWVPRNNTITWSDPTISSKPKVTWKATFGDGNERSDFICRMNFDWFCSDFSRVDTYTDEAKDIL